MFKQILFIVLISFISIYAGKFKDLKKISKFDSLYIEVADIDYLYTDLLGFVELEKKIEKKDLDTSIYFDIIKNATDINFKNSHDILFGSCIGVLEYTARLVFKSDKISMLILECTSINSLRGIAVNEDGVFEFSLKPGYENKLSKLIRTYRLEIFNTGFLFEDSYQKKGRKR